MRKSLKVGLSTALAGLVLILTPAVAAADCEQIPVPAGPNAGYAGQLDPVDTSMTIEDPEDYSADELRGPDPFAADSETTIYAEYGWGAFKVNSYDPPDQGVPGCLDNKMSSWVDDQQTNAWINLSTLAASLTVAAVRLVFAPSTLEFLNPILELLNEATGHRFFLILFPITVLFAALFMVHKVNKNAEVGATASRGLFIVALAAGALASTFYVTTLASKVDSVVVGVISHAGSVVAKPFDPGSGGTGEVGDVTLPDVVGANLSQHVLYESWCKAHFGRNPDAADAYCADLFKAANYSRTEEAAIQSNPGFADDLRERHEDEYRAVAKKVKEDYPSAYVHLRGEASGDRTTQFAVAAICMLIATGIISYALLTVLYALQLVRIFIAVFPGLATVAVLPGRQSIVVASLDYVVNKIVVAILFTSVTLVWVAAGLGALNSPSSVGTLLSLVLMLLGTYAMWKLVKHFQINPTVRDWKKRTSKRRGTDAPPAPVRPTTEPAAPSSSPSPAPVPPPPLPGPSSAPATPVQAPSPRASYVKGASRGIAQGAAFAVLTGGTATAATVAVGAARGVAGTYMANRAARRDHPTHLPYYPADVRRPTARPATQVPASPAPAALPPGKAASNAPAVSRVTASPQSKPALSGRVYTPAPDGAATPGGSRYAPTSPEAGAKRPVYRVYTPTEAK